VVKTQGRREKKKGMARTAKLVKKETKRDKERNRATLLRNDKIQGARIYLDSKPQEIKICAALKKGKRGSYPLIARKADRSYSFYQRKKSGVEA